METTKLCADFKGALEKQFGWTVLRMEKDDYDFLFTVVVPDKGEFWTEDKYDMPDSAETVHGLRIEGFGKGCVLCSMAAHYAVKEFHLVTELPLEEKARRIFEQKYDGILEVLSITDDNNPKDQGDSITVRVRILPGQVFSNDYALNIRSIDGAILEFSIEDFDLSGILEEEISM